MGEGHPRTVFLLAAFSALRRPLDAGGGCPGAHDGCTAVRTLAHPPIRPPLRSRASPPHAQGPGAVILAPKRPRGAAGAARVHADEAILADEAIPLPHRTPLSCAPHATHSSSSRRGHPSTPSLAPHAACSLSCNSGALPLF
jgi:hypothetical protein